MKKNKNLKEIISLVLLVLFFILVSYIVQTNMSFIENNLDSGFVGIFIYIFITTFATVIAPISAIPILPLAVFLFGWEFAAIYSVIGWWIGSNIAFILARKYGVNIVRKFVPIEKITKYENYIPKKDLFLSIIIIRIFLPVDVLSYILGLFSKVDLKIYSLATFIGLIPFAIILSYLGTFPIKYQLLFFIIGIIFFGYLYYKIDKKLRNKNAKTGI